MRRLRDILTVTPQGTDSSNATTNRIVTALAAALVLTMVLTGIGYADVPARQGPLSAGVPNPGTQEQELANITAPLPYNVYEFVVTCGACHGGTIDQQAGHFGNWAGSNMASAARDPVFRANQIIVNNAIKSITGEDGAGNVCMRCHSPNGWYSGRFNPALNGSGDGSQMLHSILASTDDEGILCEFCHRTIGNVTMKDPDVAGSGMPWETDPAWNLLLGISDWPHLGDSYESRGNGPLAGDPFGDATLQINDGMTYGGKFPGSVDVYFSDRPEDGTLYTGQTYGVYPDWWITDGYPTNPVPPGEPTTVGDNTVVYGPDGSTTTHFEVPIGPPIDPVTGRLDYWGQAVSLEHPTFDGAFIESPEFCGSCHDLTVPVLNHGMPEQRTYTEWKYSDFGTDLDGNGQVGGIVDGVPTSPTAEGDARCQDCHMPTMKHEYSDDVAQSLNPDPTLAGWFPYAKDRNKQGGTAFHKFAGANRDLPDMMALLYPEVDLEVIGAPTGRDTRIFPGMMSDRSLTLDRAQRNTEVSLLDAVDVEVMTPPTESAETPGTYTMQVKVTNKAGHRIPSGYPDGRRLWIGVKVVDDGGVVQYESGLYDEANARLLTDSTTPFNRALSSNIDEADNAVMSYERVTGSSSDGGLTYVPSPNLLNDTILFDNRIPPKGFDYSKYSIAGTKFVRYDPATYVPSEDTGRFTDNTDTITYTFSAPTGSVLTAEATAYWQTHTREFMEHLKESDTSTLRPEGPPSVFAVNYPLTPNFLSDVIGLAGITDLDGNPLNDNWGGVAYAAWLNTGMGAPYPVASDSTAYATPPGVPANVVAVPYDPFRIDIGWDPVADADGYLVWISYGLGDTTATWDKLAVVFDDGDPATPLSFQNDGLNVGKSYRYKVQAFNGDGYGPASTAVTAKTLQDVPLEPLNLRQVLPLDRTTITLSWTNQADNQTGFVIQRQDVPVVADFVTIAEIANTAPAGNAVIWTDMGPLEPGRTYNYRVAAVNAVGLSVWSLPVAAGTYGVPLPPENVTATQVSTKEQVLITWTDLSSNEDGFRVERSDVGPDGPWVTIATTAANLVEATDKTVVAGGTYWYRVLAFNTWGEAASLNVASIALPGPPLAPTGLIVVEGSVTSKSLRLQWEDNALSETGFYVEQSTDNVRFKQIATVGPLTGTGAVTYDVTKLKSATTYFFRVRAFNAFGASAYSNTVSAVTP